MLISVIVPVYNVKEYLAKCLQSILEQTYKNIELICVDDGSTDGSGAICDEYAERDARVRVAHKVNGGVSSARNAGIELAQGDYIAFVDSDDWLDLDYFEQAVAILEREHPVSLLNNFVRDYGNGVLVNKFLGASNAKVMNSEEAIYAICDNRFTGWEAVATIMDS
jgi:glycosyltransferase involved in cell wall biosynthesis